MSQSYIGQIQAFGFNFAPRNWAFCNGQIMSIAQNTALFSLLGTTYGGNGQTTFALPDLRGRSSMHYGQGPGLSNYTIGEQAGQEAVTLITTEMPAHTHALNAASGGKLNNVPAANNFGGANIYTNAALDSVLDPATIGTAGGSQPHQNMQPYLVLNWCICINGIFPSRN
ncbi:MAG TPA: tail fiber protein [Pyrinomonadaceae bacterium]|jgi:microcystin-dependent protein|nr:tail fiber protein [Pyrinomonadaceae bacterium]